MWGWGGCIHGVLHLCLSVCSSIVLPFFTDDIFFHVVSLLGLLSDLLLSRVDFDSLSAVTTGASAVLTGTYIQMCTCMYNIMSVQVDSCLIWHMYVRIHTYVCTMYVATYVHSLYVRMCVHLCEHVRT